MIDKVKQPTTTATVVGLNKLTLCRTYTLAQFDIRFQHRLLDPKPLRSPAELARELVQEGFVELRLDPTIALKVSATSPSPSSPPPSDRAMIIFAKDCFFLMEEDPKMIKLEGLKTDA